MQLLCNPDDDNDDQSTEVTGDKKPYDASAPLVLEIDGHVIGRLLLPYQIDAIRQHLGKEGDK